MNNNTIFTNPFLCEEKSYPEHLSLKEYIKSKIPEYTNSRFRFYATGYSTASTGNSFLATSPLAEHITSKTNQLFKSSFKLEKIWVNVNPQGAYQQRHMHPEYDVAGTYYVFCPTNSGDITFYNPSPIVESFQTLRPFYQFTYTHKPQEGDLLIWPGYLQHDVSYNYTDAIRLTISFCLNSSNK